MKTKSFTRRQNRLEKGFTLLEVLVTLVITALALLGVAGLQAQALRMNKGGEARAQALALANEMAERIEANNEGAAAVRYRSPVDDTYPSAASLKAGPCSSGPCSSNALAAYDIGIWRNQIANNSILPGGAAVITATTTGAGVSALVNYTITVCWQERAEKYDLDSGARIGVCGSPTAAQLPGLMSVTLNRTIYNRTAANGV